MYPGIRKVRTDDVGDLPQTDRSAASVIDTMGRLIGHQYAGEDLGHIVHMDRTDHGVLERQGDRVAPRRLGDALHVIDRAAHLVGARDIRASDASDAHAEFFDVVQRLPLIHDLVPGILIFAVYRIISVTQKCLPHGRDCRLPAVLEICLVEPHAMHDDCKLARDRDAGLLHANAFAQLEAPGP